MPSRWRKEDFEELEKITCVLCSRPWDPEHRMYRDGNRYIHKACLDYAKAQEEQPRMIWTPPGDRS